MRAVLVILAVSATASAGSAPDLAIARGKAFLDGGDDATGVVAFDDVVARFPASPRAADAAMLSLDALNRAQRFDELVAHVDRFMQNRPLLRHRDFAHDLRKLYMRCCWRRDVAPPPVDFERLALEHLDEFAWNPTGAFSDELLFAAGWQFCVSHHADAAARSWRVLVALFPDSRLAARARVGLGDLATCATI